MNDYKRVKYYAGYGWSPLQNVYRLDELLSNTENKHHYSIKDIIELFNIKCLCDENGFEPKELPKEKRKLLKELYSEIPKVIGKFFADFNGDVLTAIYPEVGVVYAEDFWKLISKYKIYEKIDKNVLYNLLDSEVVVLHHVLRQKEVVNYFSSEIAKYMIKNSTKAARLLVSNYLSFRHKEEKIYFPNDLTEKERQEILIRYIESEEPNVNVLKLISMASNSNDGLKLTDLIRLKAQKKYDEYFEKNKDKMHWNLFPLEIQYQKDMQEIVLTDCTGDGITQIVSADWIEENNDFLVLLNNFIYIFEFSDQHGRSLLPLYASQRNVLEMLLVPQGKSSYPVDFGFEIMQKFHLMQVCSYSNQLRRNDIRLEEIFKWFFEVYLKEEFGAEGFVYNITTPGVTKWEECRTLAAEMDSILKQFKQYCELGEIDRELFEMSSVPIDFQQVPSLLECKNAYATNELMKCIFYLFSNQSLLSITEKHGKYDSFAELLQNENVNIREYADFDRKCIDELVCRKLVIVGETGTLSLAVDKVALCKLLYERESLNVGHFLKYRQIIDEMSAEGELCYEETLFSRAEHSYLNYMLNKAQWSNGLDLRNRYIHGTFSKYNEAIQQENYWQFLMLTVMVILKINDEFCLKDGQDS